MGGILIVLCILAGLVAVSYTHLIGVITNIGPVHLELLGGISNVAQAKGELLEAMDQTGIAVLTGDDPTVRGQARNFRGKIVYYGLDAANQVVAKGISMDGEGRPSCTCLLYTSGQHSQQKTDRGPRISGI